MQTLPALPSNWKSLLLPFIGLLFVFGLFTALIYAFEPDNLSAFLSSRNAKTVITQTVIVGIGALGMTMVITSGGIDLSAGSTIALSSVACAMTINAFASGDPATIGALGMGVAALVAMATGAATGAFSGSISCFLKIPPFIVTLGTMMIARGAAEGIARQSQVRTPENPLQNIMQRNPDPEWIIFAPGVWITIILLVGVSITMRYTVFGRYIYALGSNESTARLCGIPVARTRILIYTLCGTLMGISGVMSYAFLGSGDPTTAVAKELDIIAAVVIGGGSLSGGQGSPIGSIAGALIMTLLVSGCSMLNVPDYSQKIIIGFIIIGAVAVDTWKTRRQAAG
ncbi:MAG: ABC transporter permease [Akkermansiaceae bacterium]|jgi:ribose transport system permease protein|tara:strand:- start:1803 stop:2825 length:1023 start_codon:yes stop_codon:yes gene_type:complete